jgi:hypothetical protein
MVPDNLIEDLDLQSLESKKLSGIPWLHFSEDRVEELRFKGMLLLPKLLPPILERFHFGP